MSNIGELYQLQGTEVEIESLTKTLNTCLKKLGENEKLIAARSKLISIHNRLEELKKKQQEIDWAIDDIEAKLKKSNDDLYSGRINNPKELTNLQQDVKTMESQRKQLEDEELEVMAQIETVTSEQSAQSICYKAIESEWRSEHAVLIDEAQQLKTGIAQLKEKREAMAAAIDPKLLEYYNQLKAKKGLAIAVIEQGICRGCRISLSSAELQRVRTGQVVECSSCHRILYLA
jgi:predicted  nucleic acid-binding Zn-ribbon protein